MVHFLPGSTSSKEVQDTEILLSCVLSWYLRVHCGSWIRWGIGLTQWGSSYVLMSLPHSSCRVQLAYHSALLHTCSSLPPPILNPEQQRRARRGWHCTPPPTAVSASLLMSFRLPFCTVTNLALRTSGDRTGFKPNWTNCCQLGPTPKEGPRKGNVL